MELSQADRDKIADWLNQKCGQMRCTCCGYGRWEIVPMATLPIVIDLHSTRFFYSQGVPQIGVLCANCGHTLFFNPGVIGIKPDEPPAVAVPEAPKPVT
jgi:hypothetical protein